MNVHTTPATRRCTPRPTASAAGRVGTSAIEFAVVLPTLLLIVMATIDLSRLAHASFVLSNALRAGGEYAATTRVTAYSRADWEARIRSTVQDHLTQSLGQPAGDVQVSINTAAAGDDLIETTLEATLPLDATAEWPGFGGTFVVNERYQIRQFR